MIHELTTIEMTEWFHSSPENSLAGTMYEYLGLLESKEWRSLESLLSSALGEFWGFPARQQEIFSTKAQSRRIRHSETGNFVFTTCLMKEETLLFVDIQPDDHDKIRVTLELDLFAPDLDTCRDIRDQLVEYAMKCFGLTGSREGIVAQISGNTLFADDIRKRLKPSDPLQSPLFQILKDEKERKIIRALKMRGSILETDLKDLLVPGVSLDSAKRTLDYLSGSDIALVERKFAIVCQSVGEIIFLVDRKSDLQSANLLKCPRCGNSISNESVVSYYSATESIKQLIDGNRWMPMLVKEAFVQAGVADENIYTEVKHGEDEIDVLIFYGDRIIVIEVKDRSVSLNDAYKLSAKTSRLQNLIAKSRDVTTINDDYWNEMLFVGSAAYSRETRVTRFTFDPIIVSSDDISKDARDLLQDTYSNSRFLENSDGKLKQFAESTVSEISLKRCGNRLRVLTGADSPDSISALSTAQVLASFAQWRDFKFLSS